MADTPAQQAAAGVLEDAGADEAALIAAHQSQDAEIFGDAAPVVAEPFFQAEQANEAPEGEQPQEELEIPEISWETPEDLQELLNAPDFDDEPEDEPVYTQQQQGYEQEYEEELSPREQALQRENAKLKKQAAWAEEQKVKASRKSWEAEASKYFQFSNPALIEAKSRRQFLKQAQAQHEAVAKVAKPVFDQLAALKAKAKEEGLAEARAEAEQRWGAPSAGPGAGQTLEDTQTMRRERLQQGRNLTDVLKGKLKRGEVNL